MEGLKQDGIESLSVAEKHITYTTPTHKRKDQRRIFEGAKLGQAKPNQAGSVAVQPTLAVCCPCSSQPLTPKRQAIQNPTSSCDTATMSLRHPLVDATTPSMLSSHPPSPGGPTAFQPTQTHRMYAHRDAPRRDPQLPKQTQHTTSRKPTITPSSAPSPSAVSHH
ncbi:hypothetical protein VTJ04DRAFT_7173 [Mycothermus thermophilus]|uniref:uncharacterized protein n=1 Tax=Humicola insolens TaxID=85995 RepID=UPI0037430FF8